MMRVDGVLRAGFSRMVGICTDKSSRVGETGPRNPPNPSRSELGFSSGGILITTAAFRALVGAPLNAANPGTSASVVREGLCHQPLKSLGYWAVPQPTHPRTCIWLLCGY
jgi:hypothetical protein